MSLVRSMTRPKVGMGAVIMRGMGAAMPLRTFTDTGDGITRANFTAICCKPGLIWGVNYIGDTLYFGPLGDVAKCNRFVNANHDLFDADDLCAGPLAAPVETMATPEVPTGALDPHGVVYSFPYSAETPACNGRVVATAQDASDLQTCIAQRQAAAQRAAVMEQMTESASAQCVSIKIDCARRAFGVFLKPSEDCSECVFDWTSNAAIFMVAGGLLLGGLVLVKLIK